MMKEKRIFKEIIKYFLLAVLGLVILLNSISFVVSKISDRPGRYIGRLYRVETGSMEPRIGEGDLLYVLRTPMASLSPGDAVTVKIDGRTVTHELVRFEEGTIVTKGLENEAEDLPTPFEEYLGKAVLVIPAGAVIYDALTSPAVLVAAVALVLILLLAGPVIRLILKKSDSIKIGAVRVTAGLAALSCALIPQASTLARYSASLSAKKAVSAAEMNFSSNFMTVSGNRYDIVGWNGSAYNVDFRISNYENLLKFNEVGVDVSYSITFEKVLEDETGTYSDEYSLTFTELNKERVVESAGIKKTEVIGTTHCQGAYVNYVNPVTMNVLSSASGVYILSGGMQYNDNIRLVVDASRPGGNGIYLADNQKIKFRVTARTVGGRGFERELTAVYTMTVTTAENFIEKRSFDQAPGTQVVSVNLKSATIIGINDKKVVVDWDPTIMFLNEYEANTMSLIASGDLDYDPTAGTLTFNMKASSSMTFEFYKKSSKLGITLTHTFEAKTDEFGTDYEYIKIFEKADTES